MDLWFVLAVVTMAVAVLVVAVTGLRTRASGAAWLVAAANLMVTALNSVAPFRAPLDPGYVGYSFGLLSARGGFAVTALSGSLVIATFLSAFIAVRHRSGPPWQSSPLSTLPYARLSWAHSFRADRAPMSSSFSLANTSQFRAFSG